tara:strand:- start:3503 stop:3985 length:483 start_codon:yes stop_codon:yes gene_type:complete
MALVRLRSELKQINKEPYYFYSVTPDENNFLNWDFMMIGPPETFYEGGIFYGKIEFTSEYPNKPPKLRFTSEMHHPNIYKDGNVCISILHEGVDQYNYEQVNERWNPSHSVSSILMSVLSILGSPNFESPANIDASTEWKNSIEDYKKKIYKLVCQSESI